MARRHLACSGLLVVTIGLGGCGGSGTTSAGQTSAGSSKTSAGNASSANGSSDQPTLALSSSCGAWNSAGQSTQQAFVSQVRTSGPYATVLSLLSPSGLQSLLTTECRAINLPGATLGTIVATLGRQGGSTGGASSTGSTGNSGNTGIAGSGATGNTGSANTGNTGSGNTGSAGNTGSGNTGSGNTGP